MQTDNDAPLKINDKDYQISLSISAVQISEEMLTFFEEQVVLTDDDRNAK